jgi:hypothetical protein
MFCNQKKDINQKSTGKQCSHFTRRIFQFRFAVKCFRRYQVLTFKFKKMQLHRKYAEVFSRYDSRIFQHERFTRGSYCSLNQHSVIRLIWFLWIKMHFDINLKLSRFLFSWLNASKLCYERLLINI